MTLAAVRGGAVRKWPHLAVVAGDGTGQLAERRAAAEAVAAGHRQRVAELEAALAEAVDRGDFTGAAELQPQLTEAKEALAVASVELRLLGEAQAEVETERQAGQRALQEAQRRGQVQRMLDAAHGAEQDALAATDAALGVMRANLLAAQAAFQEARRAEEGVLVARRQEIEARRALGEWGHHPGPLAVSSQKCQTLQNTSALVRELARWRP